MTHEYAPTALPERQEAVVHRRIVEVDVNDPFLSPEEREALLTVETLPERLETRRSLSLERQAGFATIVGAEAVSAVIAAPTEEKRTVVAQNLVLNVIEQNVDHSLLQTQSPEEREAIVMAVLEKLRQAGHDRIDPEALRAIAIRDAMIAERDEHIQKLRDFQGTAEQVVETLKESTQGDPDAMEMIEEAVRPLEAFNIEELSDLPDAKRITTAEMNLIVNGNEVTEEPEIVFHQVTERKSLSQSARSLASRALQHLMKATAKRPSAARTPQTESMTA
jgi:hypothetical protein